MVAATFDTAIVGAGLSGTALAIHLARSQPKQSRAVLIGTPGETGRGLAYRDGNTALLLNVAADRLSLDPDDPQAFVDWLAQNRRDANDPRTPSGRYARRTDYGAYVAESLRAAIKNAEGTTASMEGTVVAIAPGRHGFHIRLANGEHLHTTPRL